MEGTAKTSNNYLITAAIDFGTTFSGYAYSFNTDLEKTPPQIIANNWNRRNTSPKAPTSVLFDENQTFHSFGYDAEEKYALLCEDEEHDAWYFFRRFKMLLFDCEDLTKSTELTEIGGKKMLAVKVFAAAIQFLVEHFMEALHKRLPAISEDFIKWVLTVPAIWSDASKMFMREAAVQAGVNGDRLTIALEPESAAVYCQRVPTEICIDEKEIRLCISEAGSKFMVLDMGGGTIDITVHKRKEDGSLEEIAIANGGPWGGIMVDDQFIELLKSILGGEETGVDALQQIKEGSMADYMDIVTELEIKKKDASAEKNEKIALRLPFQFFETLDNIKGPHSLHKKHIRDGITRTRDKLRIDHTIVHGLFEPAINAIVKHLKGLFDREVMNDVSTILMVGGFSSSNLLQNAIKNNFPDRRVYIPPEPELAILLGAVMYGHNPKIIASRIVKFTYGIQIALPFDKNKHLVSMKRTTEGKDFCSNIFSPAITAGTTVLIGESIDLSAFKPISDKSNALAVRLFAAPAGILPTYVTDEGCKLLGEIMVERTDPGCGLYGHFELSAKFGETEIEFCAKEKISGKIMKTHCEFF